MSPYQVVRWMFLAAVWVGIASCLMAGIGFWVLDEANMLNRYANGQSVTSDATLWAGLSAIHRGTFDKW